MSQDNWEKLSQIIDQKLEPLKKDLAKYQEQFSKSLEVQPTKTSGSLKEHKTRKEEIDCPDCYKELRPLFYEKENFASKKYQCEDCGVPVNENEEECPSCRGKNARPRK